MPPITKDDAYDEIISYVDKFNFPYSDWYCGITENINQRLFGDHQVPINAHPYIYRH